ncbi:MAG: glycerol kinase GlpK [Spirosomataceae bacterium]
MAYILSIDQGTSSTKTIIFDQQGQPIARASEPLKTHYFGEGFAEQNPEDIYQNVIASVTQCIEQFKADGHSIQDIQSCGISNQRETFVVWDPNGIPLHNAIIWQCKRSVSVCESLKNKQLESTIHHKTGLLIDPYFSGTKLMWLNENVPSISSALKDKRVYFGTVDTWLLFKLTQGKQYLTDYTNASRTLFFNLNTLDWDKELLAIFGLSNLYLPPVKPSAFHFGDSNFEGIFDTPLAITAMIGDSHAAAFGEECFSSGKAKATLGTGCSILMNVGSERKPSHNGMVSTICWSMEDRVDFALEGVIVTCGATIEWLKNELGIIADSKATEEMAIAAGSNNGVYLVPAFSGLGAPHWNMKRKASITGLTFDSNKNHVVRAALEAIAYQIKDIISAMETDTEILLQELMVDGGITSNGFVLQFLADLLGKPVVRIGQSTAAMADVSALGAAYLSGLGSGIFKDIAHIQQLNKVKQQVLPCIDNTKVMADYKGWQENVS